MGSQWGGPLQISHAMTVMYHYKTVNEETTWTIKFSLNDANKGEAYKLRLELPSAHGARLQLCRIGKGNAIARYAIQDLYRLFNIEIPGTLLHSLGENSIYLTQAYNSFRIKII
ncbi:rhamnogalacturonate lyase [Artemisia annua]|uniref:Rhamnogalacturonate lyase n=1 Tax=Artemisia annua TaxID=35608 RepID=A0A2U1PKH1_ARTAN|nr:rhamnogalacturonate lyase [Artemisia annua]